MSTERRSDAEQGNAESKTGELEMTEEQLASIAGGGLAPQVAGAELRERVSIRAEESLLADKTIIKGPFDY
jgi:hypothetical protein